MLIELSLNNRLPFRNKKKTVYWFVEFAPQILLEILEADFRFILTQEVLDLQMSQKYKRRFKSLTEQRKKSEQELKELFSFTSTDDISGGNWGSYEFSLKYGGIRYGI